MSRAGKELRTGDTPMEQAPIPLCFFISGILFYNGLKSNDPYSFRGEWREMAEIVFLGTTGPYPSRMSDNTSLFLALGSCGVLVDSPGGVLRKLLAAGFGPENLDYIFLTHIHTDHIYGLPSIFHGLMLRERVIRIVGSAETTAFARGLLDVFGLMNGKYRTRAEFIELAPGAKLELPGGVTVEGFKVPHHSSSLAYIFEGGGRTVALSGDTPPCPGLFERIKGADVLVHDCGGPRRLFDSFPALKTRHTDALRLGELSRDAGIKLLAPCHFLAELDFRMAELCREIKVNYDGELFIPRGMDRLMADMPGE